MLSQPGKETIALHTLLIISKLKAKSSSEEYRWFRNFHSVQSNTKAHENETSQKLDLTSQDFQKNNKKN